MHPIGARLPVGKAVRRGTTVVVVAHDTKGQQAIAIIALLLREVIEVQLAIARLCVCLESIEVLSAQSVLSSIHLRSFVMVSISNARALRSASIAAAPRGDT